MAPKLTQAVSLVVQSAGQAVEIHRTDCRQSAVDLDRFQAEGQGLGGAPERAVDPDQAVEGVCQNAGGGRIGGSQPSEDLHCFQVGSERVLESAEFAVAISLIIQGMGQLGHLIGIPDGQ